jgi:hypothetical protein
MQQLLPLCVPCRLPVVSIALFGVHAWSTWEDAAMGSLALEVFEFNLVPIIVYVVTRWVTNHLHRLVVTGVLHLARWQGAQFVTNHHKYWVATCTCLVHIVLSTTLIKVLLKGPLQVPAGLNPFQLLDVGKLCILSMLQRMNLLNVTRMVSEEGPNRVVHRLWQLDRSWQPLCLSSMIVLFIHVYAFCMWLCVAV